MVRFLLAFSSLAVTASSAWAGATDLFPEKVKDFGTSARGQVLVHYFRFTNTTNQMISLGQPRVSCGCTSAAVTTNSLAPGGTAAVVAYMDTRRISVPYTTKSVIVYVPVSMGNSFEEVALRVQTVCRDDLMFSPDTLAMGTVKHGEGGKATTKVTLTSDATWQVTEATSTGKFVKVEFKQESRNGSIVTYEVTATLDPACPEGNWVSDIHLKTSNVALGLLRIPVTVNVTPNVATTTPETVQLGEVTVGNAVEKKVVVQAGGVPFKVVGVKGADDVLGVSVEGEDAKASQTIKVSLNPTQTGKFMRSVELLTDNKDKPKLIIPISATVVGK